MYDLNNGQFNNAPQFPENRGNLGKFDLFCPFLPIQEGHYQEKRLNSLQDHDSISENSMMANENFREISTYNENVSKSRRIHQQLLNKVF